MQRLGKCRCVVVGLGLAWGLIAGHAAAQTQLERLEGIVRKQLDRGEGEKKPAPAAAAPANPAPSADAGAAKPAAPAPGGEPSPPVGLDPAKAAPRARPYLGVVADDQNDRGRGVRVLEIVPNGPGAKAGLQTQDLITAISGMRVKQMSDMADILELYAPGDKATFEVLRDDKSLKVQFVLGLRPGEPAPQGPAKLSELNGDKPRAAGAPGRPDDLILLPPPTSAGTPAASAPATGKPQTPPVPPAGAKPDAAIVPPAAAAELSPVERLERRIQQLEQRVAELERALGAKSPAPGKP